MKWEDKGGVEFEQAPVGTHVARCIRIIDIGTHEGEYQGVPNIRRQCILVFELANELMIHGEAAGKPFVVSKFYTASLGKKATLRKDLVCWRGRDFTPEELHGFESKNVLDKSCLLSITASEKGKSRISGVMSLPKGAVVPKRVNELLYFSLDEFDPEIFDRISDGLKKMIMDSHEYQKRAAKVAEPEHGRDPGYEQFDEVPF